VISRRTLVALLVVDVVVMAAAALYLLRAPIEVASEADPDVTIECAAATGVEGPACLAWGDEIIAGDPPSFTFEMEDLVRLRLDRAWFGFGSECHAQYLIARYAEPAFSDEVVCADAP
jgi:hypothetical protein